MTQYIWQHSHWPNFTFDSNRLLLPLGRCRYLQGQLIQQVSSLGLDLELATQLETLTQEAVKTAEFEGELYHPEPLPFIKIANTTLIPVSASTVSP